jgi:hypothetical protein
MKWALLLVLVGGAIRCWHLAQPPEEMRDDEVRFVEIARSLREGDGFAIAEKPTAQTMPLWPAVLSLLPAPQTHGRWLAALFSTLLLPVAWLAAKALAGPRVALLALGLLAVDLDSAQLGGSLLAEPLFALLIGLFALMWAQGRLLPAAIALAAAVLTRPEAALLPFAFAIVGREVRKPFVLLVAAALACGMWAHRNHRVFGEYLPFTTTGGITLHSAMNEKELELPLKKRGQGRAEVEYRHFRDLAISGSEVEYDRQKGREAVAFARERPFATLGLAATKFVRLWTPLQRKGTSAVYALAVVLAWCAFFRRVRFMPVLVGPMLFAMTVVGVVFLAIPRYRVPYHPYLFVLAAAVVLQRRETTR